MFVRGQGVLGRVRFADGEMPSYNRTYLVIGVYSDYIELLNVSSSEGKEHKLLMRTNEGLRVYDPPFVKPSFVKLDSLVRVYSKDYKGLHTLHGGKCLDQKELERISNLLREYQNEG